MGTGVGLAWAVPLPCPALLPGRLVAWGAVPLWALPAPGVTVGLTAHGCQSLFPRTGMRPRSHRPGFCFRRLTGQGRRRLFYSPCGCMRTNHHILAPQQPKFSIPSLRTGIKKQENICYKITYFRNVAPKGGKTQVFLFLYPKEPKKHRPSVTDGRCSYVTNQSGRAGRGDQDSHFQSRISGRSWPTSWM